MEPKFFAITLLFFLNTLLANELKAQTYPVDKGAKILSGKLHFSSSGGDLFENNDEDRQTELTFNPAFSFFPVSKLFLGGQFSYSEVTQDNVTNTSIGIGPHIGVAIGNPDSNVYPYASAAALFNKSRVIINLEEDIRDGYSFIFTGGVLVPIIKHVGLDVSLSYKIVNQKRGDNVWLTGNSFVLGVGIVGLFHN